MQRADEPAESLLQRDHRGRHLVVEERVAAVFINRADARGHHRIVRHGERQPVNDDATELFALHVHTLPERRGGEQHGVRGKAKLIEQRAARRRALQQHGKFELAQQAVVQVAHLRVAGEEAEGAPARDLQQFADACRRARAAVGRAWIGQVGRNVEHGLLREVEVRGHHQLARVLHAQPGADVLEGAGSVAFLLVVAARARVARGDGERGGSEHCGFHLLEERLAQDSGDVDRGGLEENVFAFAASTRSAAKSPALDPHHRVAIVVLQDEAELHLQLFAAANEREDLVGLVADALHFRAAASERFAQR